MYAALKSAFALSSVNPVKITTISLRMRGISLILDSLIKRQKLCLLGDIEEEN